MMFQKRIGCLEKFIDILKKDLKRQLVSIIGYGSFFDKRIKDVVDVDLVIVLRSKQNSNSDLARIKKAIEKSGLEYLIQTQIIYKDRILRDGNFYSIHTCGPFFLKTLIKGKVLFGENIFKKIKQSDRLFLLLSVLQKTQQYNYQFKNLYLNLVASDDFSKIIHFIDKKLECILSDGKLFFREDMLKKGVIKDKDAGLIEKNKRENLSIEDVEQYLLKAVNTSDKILLEMINYIHKLYGVEFL